MKYPAQRFVIPGLIAAAMCANGASAQLQGQRQLDPRAPREATTASSNDPVQGAPLFTVNFNGGTVADYIEALRAANHGSAPNVACSQELMKATIGPIQLESVSLFTALNAIGAASTDSRTEWGVQPLDMGMQEHVGAKAFRLMMQRRDNSPFAGMGTTVKTFALREYVGTGDSKDVVKKAGTLISAVEATLDKGETGEHSWSVKFHPESALLIIRGSSDDIAAASQVVNQLVGESHAQEAVEETRKQREIERQRNMEVAQKLLMQAQEEREVAMAMVNKAQKELGGDAANSPALDAARQRYAEAADNYKFRQEQFRRVEEQRLFGRDLTSASIDRNLVSSSNQDQAEAKIRELQAMVESLKAQLQELQQNRLRAPVNQPIPGRPK